MRRCPVADGRGRSWGMEMAEVKKLSDTVVEDVWSVGHQVNDGA